MGDFWGLNDDSLLKKSGFQNLSLVFINTEKGKDLFDKTKNCFVYELRNCSEAISGNSQLRGPVEANKQSQAFLRTYCGDNFKKAVVKSRSFRKKITKLPVINWLYKKIR